LKQSKHSIIFIFLVGCSSNQSNLQTTSKQGLTVETKLIPTQELSNEQRPKQQAKPLPKQQAKPLPKQRAKPLPKQQAKPLPKQQAKPLPKQQAKPLPKQQAKPLPKQQAKPLPKQQVKPLPKQQAKPLPDDAKLLLPPTLPVLTPNIKAPKKFKHPLTDADKLIFMLGEDEKGLYLYGEGAIVEGAFDKFQLYINYYNNKNITLNRLMLHSPGGLVNEGLKMGGYIRQNSWTTDSDKHMKCYSACALIFAAGVKKRIQAGAEVGFHRPYDPVRPDTPEFIDIVYKQYKPYWHYIQGSPALYDIFMKGYGREDMLILKADSIDQYMNVETY